MDGTTEMKGACSHCRGHIVFPAEWRGQSADCPHCGKATVLQPVGQGPAKAKTVSAVVCPQCRAPMDEADVICVQCGFRMPRAIPWLRVALVAVMLVELGYAALRWDGMTPATRAALSARLGFAVKTPVAQAASSGPGEGNASATPVPVAVLPPDKGTLIFATAPTLKQEGDFNYIVGSVKNTSARDVFYDVTVKFRLSDGAGAALGNSQDYAPWVEAGKTWDFRVLVLDPDATKWDFIEPIGGRR